jgi:hypothetical protein
VSFSLGALPHPATTTEAMMAIAALLTLTVLNLAALVTLKTVLISTYREWAMRGHSNALTTVVDPSVRHPGHDDRHVVLTGAVVNQIRAVAGHFLEVAGLAGHWIHHRGLARRGVLDPAHV